jgi:hypothetical protein
VKSLVKLVSSSISECSSNIGVSIKKFSSRYDYPLKK